MAMVVIWKWRLERPGTPFTLELPIGYCIVHAGLDGGQPMYASEQSVLDGKGMPAVWAEVDPSSEKTPVQFLLVATGQEYDPDEWVYLHTLDVSGYFFHLLSEC
jgi:hypothetical protein